MSNYGTAGPKSNLFFFFRNYMSVVSVGRTDFLNYFSKNDALQKKSFENPLIRWTVFRAYFKKFIFNQKIRKAQRKLHS